VNDKPAFSTDGSSKGVLIYIHGYNMTLESALMKTGQVAWDIDYAGQPVAEQRLSPATERVL
jgi:esterase/lipase superfamily enzyme